MRQAFAWHAFLIRDRSINAFALPGGYVGIHLGLIAGTPSRDELASVLAHELSHVSQRHIARSFESAGRQSTLGLAAMLLGMIAASRSGNADIAQAAIAGGQAAMIQGQLNFSREMEREADRIGHQVLVSAGFAGSGMASMFDRLQSANRLNDSGNFPYLRSHPLTVERIAEARSRVEAERPVPRADDPEHDLMRARARVLMQPSVEALRSHVQALADLAADRPAPPALAYAAAHAASLLRDPVGARAALARLAEGPAARAPATARWVELLQLEVALADPSAGGVAVAPPGEAAWGPPEGWERPELLLRGRTWLARAGTAGDKAAADLRALHEALRGWLVRHPADGAAWEMLASLEDRRGNRLAMLRATAEANLAAGKLDAAIVTLQSARAQGARSPADDAVELAIIDSRLADLRRQRVARATER
jgi:predicted Zn-dependent protease